MSAGRSRPAPPPWWTSADQAELALLVGVLLQEAAGHKERCDLCEDGGPSCPTFRKALGVAVEAILEWRWARSLSSRAVWLREQQILVDEEVLERRG